MDSIPTELNILTLNCWGLKYLAKFRNERMTEIGKQLAITVPVPHIVGLQECWTNEDFQSIREETKHILPFGKFYHSGIFGGGLAILSKWPLEESSMYRYPLNGRPTAFYRGDWYVGKGVAYAKIRFGTRSKDVVEVFTTHLHAPYEPEPFDSYLCHRIAQAWEISKLMKGAAERGHLVLGLGDFNSLPLSLAHRVITTQAPVRDIWRVLHPDSSLGRAGDEVELARGRPIPTATFNLLENGVASDNVSNTWRWNKAHQKRLGPNRPKIEIPGDTPDPDAKRLDYIFASNGARPDEPGAWVVKEARVGMMQRHPTLQCSLSDHYSVEATLIWYRGSTQDNGKSEDDFPSNDQTSTLSERHKPNYGAQLQPLSGDTPSLSLSTFDDILAMIEKYAVRERKQRRFRLYHFLVSIFVSIGCLVAVWWSPRNFVSFLLMLLSTLGLSAGVVDGLIGGLFVGSELRALKEYEWEIKNARFAAGGQDIGDDLAVRDW